VSNSLDVICLTERERERDRWGINAGAIIVTEAGGSVMDPTGVPLELMGRRVLAGTPEITKQLSVILKGCQCGSKEPPPPVYAK
jgi:fructose-1,6-bisphosphatase/inositol monophosphatase family enzyme